MMFANMPTPILVHFLFALVALPLGLWQLLAAKGTPVHRRLGQIYVVVMLIVLLSALMAWRPGAPFLFFYSLAIIGLYSLGDGMLNLRRWLRGGEPAHLRRHKISMGYSWLGLFMAAASQLLVNPRFGISGLLPGPQFWSLFAAINILLYGAGSWWIFRRLAPTPVSGGANGRGNVQGL